MEKKRIKVSGYLIKLIVLLIIGILVQFFINEFYKIGALYSSVMALLTIGFLYYFWSKGFFHFLLVFLIGTGVFISLGVSFDLGILPVFIVSIVLALIFGIIYIEFESNKNYTWLLFIAFLVIFTILAFNVKYRADWKLENYLTLPFVILLLIASKWFKFSKISYSLIFTYMFLHIVGSHYTYSEVPFGFWLQNFYNLDRNHYDRLVHFVFGLLLAYPVREVFVRVGNYKGIWALFSPIIFVLGLSCVYELIEWGAAVFVGGDLGIAYLGTQGDIWDAQKDMFLAGIGSIIAMLVTFATIMGFRAKDYWIEIKESFKVHKGELGEVALNRWKKK